MFCNHCGAKLVEGARFCSLCGGEVVLYYYTENLEELDNTTVINNEKKKRVRMKTCKFCSSSIDARLSTCPRCQRVQGYTNMQTFLMVLGGIILFIFIYSISPKVETSSSNTTSYKEKVQDASEDFETEISSSVSKFDVFDSEQLEDEFIKACKQVNIDINDVVNINRIHDWNNGARYTFNYMMMKLTIYVNGEDDLVSINIGDIKVFQNFYEPLDINDFIFNDTYRAPLKIWAEDNVLKYVYLEDEARFVGSSWSFSRYKSLYTISGEVEVKNNFGVQDTVPFYVQGNTNDLEEIKLSFLSLDGNVEFGEAFTYDNIYVEAESNDTIIEEGRINLIYGVIGEYGFEEVLDDVKYIKYKIPSGKYQLTSESNNTVVFLLEEETIINSDGYTEHPIIKMIRIADSSKSYEIEVHEDMVISVTIHAEVNFEQID